MSDEFYKFKNKSELVEFLGISRPTLNSRLVKLGVKVESTPFTLTSLQIKALKTDNRQNKSYEKQENNSETSKQLSKISQDSNQITKLKQEITVQQKQLIEIQDLRIVEQKEHGQRIIDLTNKMIKIQDQAQQLQLDLQTKISHSEQERLTLLSNVQQLTDTNARFDAKDKTIANLKAQISTDKQERTDLQEQLSSQKDFASYLHSENRGLEKDKTILLEQQSEAAVAQQTIEQLQTKLEETQNLVQEKDRQRQLLADRSTSLSDKLTDTRKQLKDEQNKSFWKRVFGR